MRTKGFLKGDNLAKDREGRGYEFRVLCWCKGEPENGMNLDELACQHHLKRTKCHICGLKLSSQFLRYYQIPTEYL